ncbi:uncharacterized protein LOC103514996, partial [Diaphorina citri]|uniref:Uncharacterized protein LOC103514996 n=1 Tax=Diaphorina citri TaxID=121845 RepID=A0A3Q0J5B8_DIACI
MISGGYFSEALQKEKYEHNRMLAEKRDEHLMKEKALYEDLHLLQSQRAKLLKQHDPHNNKIVKENEKLQKALYEDLHLLQSQRAKLLKQHDPHNNKIVKENEKLQDEIRKKMEATKSAIQMLTDIIGDHMQYTIPQSGVLCDQRMNLRMKGKIYRTIVGPAMMYGSETWPVKKNLERRLEVAEMRMLRWICGVTRLDRIRNEIIRSKIKVTEISKKIQERRLQWYGHVQRREENYIGKKIARLEVKGKRGREHQSSSSSRQQSHQRYQRQLQLDKFNRFRRSVSVEPSAYRSQQKSFIQKSGTVANYGSRYSNQRKQRRREGGAWGETRHPVPGRGKRGGYQGRRGNRRRQNMRNMMNRDHEDDDAMDLEMPPPPNQHFRHNIHNKKGFKSSFNPRPPLLPLPLPPCPPPSMMMLPPPAPPVYDMPPPPPPPPLSHQDNTSSSSSSSEALQKEKYEHNRMLAEKRDEHLMKEKALYEDLHLLQSQRAKLLKQHDPHNNKIVKENEKLQDEIRKKMEATKSAIQMLTDIIGDHMQYTIPQVSRRVSAGSPEHKSDSSESSEDDDESHSSSDTASEAPPSPPNMPPPSPDRPKRKPYLISRNRNIFVRRRDITTRDRRKIDTTAYIQTAGQAVLKSQQQETLEEKSQKMEQKLHHCDDTDSEDIFPLASSVENKSTKRTMEEDIEDIFNLRRPATQRPHVEDMETEGDEKEREEEENNTSTQ